MLMVIPAVLLYWLACLLFGTTRIFPGWSQMLSLLPGLSGQYLRRAFYSIVLRGYGDDAVICFGSVFSHPTAVLGRGSYVGLFCCLGDVTLEEDALVGSHVSIINGAAQHGTDRLDVPIRDQPGTWPRITIGRNSWVGDRAIVMADIGKHCIIGAGSVVTRPVPDYAVVAGVPARILRFRNFRDGVSELV